MAKRFLAALGATVLGLTVTAHIEPSPGPELLPAGSPADVVARATKLGNLPLAAQAQISLLMGREQSSYHAVPRASGFRMVNPNHGLQADFTSAGVQVRVGAATWNLSLSGYGYGDRLSAATAAAPHASANRLEYPRGDVIEWYVNGTLGLEQGFTVAHPPAEPRGEPLTLALSAVGLTASIDASGTAATLSGADGRSVLHYRGLTAHDATGRELNAWMQIEGDQLRLRVDDTNARYPLVVDPFIQQAKLGGSDSAALDEFGTSVAMSGDTIVVGVLRGNGAVADTGAAYVFVKPAGGWTGDLIETAKLISSDGGLNNQFGWSVAIDGNTVVVGTSIGAAYVFEKPAVGWSGTLTENAKLVASDCCHSYFAVAVSGDTVVAGSQNKDFPTAFEQGAAYVFVKPMAGWSGVLNESARLTASDGAGGDFFGRSVAMTANAVVVGAVQNDAGLVDTGGAYVFIEPALGWSGFLNESAKLVASDRALGDLLGWSVALNGDTIVAGAPRVGGLDNGAAYVFEKPAAGWSGTLTENARLVGSDGGGNLGVSIDISGNTAAAGAFIDSANAGKTYIFIRPPAGWSGTLTETQIIPAPAPSSGTVFSPRFGASIAAHGGTVVISESRERVGSNDFQGAVYIYQGQETDVSISKIASPEPVIAGDTLSYTITVANSGPDAAAAVTVTDNLPAEVSFVSCAATGGGSCVGSGNNQSITLESMAAGSSETITIVAAVDPATPHGTFISNTASVTAATSDPNSGNDFSTTTTSVVNQADLVITKTASLGMVETGANLTYTITVANNGPNSATNASLIDNLPAGTTFVSNSGSSGWICVDPAPGTTGTVTCSIASLAAGSSVTFTLVSNVGCGVAHAAVISNTATITSTTPDLIASNNSSTASVSASNPAPIVSAAVAMSSLSGMQNPELVNVGLSAATSDGACPAPAVSTVEVFSDEDDETPSGPNQVFSPDATDIGVGTLRVRAERVRSLDGRVYLIVVRSTDAGGAVGFATTTVVVPRTPSPSSASSVNASAAAAKAFADGNNGNPPPGYFVIGDGPIIGPLQ